MGLVQELAGSTHRTADCTRLAAIWIAHIDGSLDDRERASLLQQLPDQIGGIPLERLVGYVEAAMACDEPEELATAFAYLRHALPDASRGRFLRLMVDMVVADGRVSIGERHALMFLADLVERTNQLPEYFAEATKQAFGLPGDLSDPAYWESVAAQSRSRASGGTSDDEDDSKRRHDRSERSRSKAQDAPTGVDAKRVEALATLGLVGNPSLAEIKAAYRRLATVHHPDRHHGLTDGDIRHATKAFQRIQAAYALLTG